MAGARSAYNPQTMPVLAYWMARSGLRYPDIARQFGVTRKTLYQWRNKYPELEESLDAGRDVVDTYVEAALLANAMGGVEVEDTKERVPLAWDEHGNPTRFGMRITKRRTKTKSGDTTAQIFWLKNRRPEAWRDVRAVDLSTPNGPIRIGFEKDFDET